MPAVRGRLARLWSTDWGLTVLLGSLTVLVFVVPPLQASATEGPVLVSQLFFTAVFLSGLRAATASHAWRLVGTVVFTGAVALYWTDYFFPEAGLPVVKALAGLCAVSLLAGLIVHHVFREGPITRQRIEGAVAVYLLLGVAWANVYNLIAAVWPDAFRFADPPRSRSELWPMLGYYSFVTLTTVGYGDVTPVHPIARSAAILEALTGQLFPAILIARLVAMELSARESGRPTRR